MDIGIIDIVLFILFFQLLSLIPFLLFDNKKNGYANKILAAFLFAKVMCISNFICYNLYDIGVKYFPHLFYIGSSFTILWGPLLYFYTRSLINDNFRFNTRHLLHFIPFGIHFIFMFFKFHMYGTETKQMLLLNHTVISQETTAILMGLVHLSILIYTVAALKIIFDYRIKIKESFSSVDSINMSWMVFVLSGFSIKWIFDVIYFIQTDIFQTSGDIPLYVSRISLFLFINIMIFKGLRYPGIFSGLVPERSTKKPFLSKSLQDEYLKKLIDCMENEKPYLDPDINLMDLSEKTAIPYRSLSEVINNVIGKNFYDFINSYRIKESQRLLSEKSADQKTILEIIYEVGYNSKSSFNNAFKKFTGMTPTEYKKLCQY